MRAFFGLLRRFQSDERGAFIAIFGILAIVLIATAGAVVDYTSMEQARTRAQVALDAASLALQPRIYTSDTDVQIKAKAQALLTNRIADTRITATVLTATRDTVNGDLYLTARLTVPMSFVALIGINTLSAAIESKATRKKLNLEVVMVLDNSNSMSSNSRMTNLISAAKCAENILFNGDCNSTATTTSSSNVWLGVVPFTLGVNVGTGNSTQTWLDASGVSAIARNNFDSDDDSTTTFAGPVNRLSLFTAIGQSWGGCVEARKAPYDTDDTVPNAAVPDTLFVPYFAPDEPDSGYNNDYLSDTPNACKYNGTCSYVQTVTKCDSNGNNCQNSGTTSYSSTLSGQKTGSLSCSCSTSGGYAQTQTGGTSGNTNWTRKRTWTCSVTYDAQIGNRELQERLCKYTGTASNISQASVRGPNGDCPTNAITPLTSTKATVTAAMNALDPQGGTNIHMGVEWGLHVLSPTAPFTEGKPYGQTTSKVMIVMTDGENTSYQTNNMNGATYYSSYGFPYNARMGNMSSSDDQLETEMDTRTVAACATAKAAGITVYTIGLATAQTSDQTKVETMLKNCSSGIGYYYFPAASSELTSVFQTIANQLAALRIAT